MRFDEAVGDYYTLFIDGCIKDSEAAIVLNLPKTLHTASKSVGLHSTGFSEGSREGGIREDGYNKCKYEGNQLHFDTSRLNLWWDEEGNLKKRWIKKLYA